MKHEEQYKIERRRRIRKSQYPTKLALNEFKKKRETNKHILVSEIYKELSSKINTNISEIYTVMEIIRQGTIRGMQILNTVMIPKFGSFVVNKKRQNYLRKKIEYNTLSEQRQANILYNNKLNIKRITKMKTVLLYEQAQQKRSRGILQSSNTHITYNPKSD